MRQIVKQRVRHVKQRKNQEVTGERDGEKHASHSAHLNRPVERGSAVD